MPSTLCQALGCALEKELGECHSVPGLVELSGCWGLDRPTLTTDWKYDLRALCNYCKLRGPGKASEKGHDFWAGGVEG